MFLFLACATLFFFLKATRPPCRRSPPSRRQSSRGQPPRAQLALGFIRMSVNSELVSAGQDFLRKRGFPLPRAQVTLQRLQQQHDETPLWFAEGMTGGCGDIPRVCTEGRLAFAHYEGLPETCMEPALCTWHLNVKLFVYIPH